MIRQLKYFSTGILVLGLLASGCTEKAPAPTAPAQAKKVAAKGAGPDQAVAAPETVVVPPKYVYDPTGRRDPFIPLVVTAKKSAATAAAEQGEAVEPLQKFDLDQLRLVGIIMVKPQPLAMVAAPDGKSYVLKKGVKLGRNNGSVIAITVDAVIVQEQYIDISGDIRTATVEIKLPKKEGV